MNELGLELLHFVQQAIGDSHQVTVDCDLMSAGIMDSLLLMDLILYVEQRWSVCLSGEDISPQNFRSLADLTTFIHARRHPRAA